MHGDAAVPDAGAGVAAAPHVAVDVDADAVGAAAHAVDGEIAERLDVGDLVVGGHVARHHAAARDDVHLLVVGRERDAVGNRAERLFAGRHVDAAARIDAIY